MACNQKYSRCAVHDVCGLPRNRERIIKIPKEAFQPANSGIQTTVSIPVSTGRKPKVVIKKDQPYCPNSKTSACEDCLLRHKCAWR